MAFFTALWAGWATSSSGGWFIALAIAFWLAAGLFAANGIHLLAVLRRFPAAVGDDAAEGRLIGRRFGMLFGAEGLVIGIACGVLGGLGLYRFFAPVIMLVVGLHFIPLAWVFHRRIDIWLGAFTAVVAVAGIITIAVHPDDYLPVWATTGFVAAAVTTTYGALMSVQKRRMLARR
jgi:hypothetical protein